jgi:ribosomal protein S18 acetylase RimI-like enzyme
MGEETCNPIRLTRADIEPAALTLAKAFRNYPVSAYFVPDETKREKTAPSVFGRILREAISSGEVYATSPRMEGVAVWLSSESKHGSWWSWFNISQMIYSLMMSKEEKTRHRAFGEYSGQVRKRVVPGRHLYLQILGVDPAYQRKGYSSMLLRPMLARADREGVPCFLDTQLEKNVALYRHFEFRVAEEGVIPGTDVYSWAMVRESGDKTDFT